MAIIEGDLNYKIDFNFEDSTSKFSIEDNTVYPADGITYKWTLKITTPSGVLYDNENATLGDAIQDFDGTEGSTWDSIIDPVDSSEITIPTDITGGYEEGTYLFLVQSWNANNPTATKVVNTTYSKVYNSSIISPPTLDISLNSDIITASVVSVDNTDYIRNLITPTVVRVFNLLYPTLTGIATKSVNTSSVSIGYPNVYTGTHIADLTSTVTYDIDTNYSITYELNELQSTSLSTSASQSTAYEGLKSYLNRYNTKTSSGDLLGAAADLKVAEEIEVFLSAYYTALNTGNSSEAQAWIDKAVNIANLDTSAETEGVTLISPVNQGFTGTNSMDVLGDAAYGTEVVTVVVGDGTETTVKLTETYKEAINDSITDSDVVYTQARFRTEGIGESRGTEVGTLTAGGGTANIDPSVGSRFYKYTGSATLTSSQTIQIEASPSTALIDGDWVIVDYTATMTLDGNSITIFGNTLSAAQALAGNVMIINIYDADTTSWSSNVISGGETDTSGLADDAVTTVKILDDAVTTAKILDTNVTAAKLATDSVTTVKILDANVTTSKILDANVTAAKLATDSVTTIKILDDNVTTAKILDANVTAAKMATDSVATINILDDNVTTAKILDANVTTAKILDANVTVEKLEADAKTDVITMPLSFETDELGDMKLVFPYPCEVNAIYYYVSKLIEGTDDASVSAKNNAAAVMGTTTIAGATAIGTGVSEAGIAANNVFATGEVMTLSTAKSTPGGTAIASIHITRV